MNVKIWSPFCQIIQITIADPLLTALTQNSEMEFMSAFVRLGERLGST